MVCLSSDAHIACQVGEADVAQQMVIAAGIRPEQVVNRTLGGTLEFLGNDEEGAGGSTVEDQEAEATRLEKWWALMRARKTEN